MSLKRTLDSAPCCPQIQTMSPTSVAPEHIDADAVIVGGGLVGMTLAAALGSAGITVAVVDREKAETQIADSFDGRASAIAAGSRHVLDGLGLWGAMAPDAEPILDIRVSDGASPLFVHYDHRDLGAGPLGHIVENRHIRLALASRLSGLDTVRILDGRTVGTLDRATGRVTAALDDGTTIRAPLALAADGRRSPSRQSAGIRATEWSYPQTGIVCTVAHERPHEGVAQEHFLPAGPFAILPMTGNRSSIVWTEREDLAPALLALDEAAFTGELTQRFGDYLGALQVEGPRFAYPLALTHAESYVAHRLALVGDAAHAIHPIAGQGLNLGIRDVAALAEVVVDAYRLGIDPGLSSVLDTYQRWRRFDNLAMLAVTDGLNRLFSNNNPPVALARDLGLAAVNRIPPLKRLLMRHAMGTVGDLPRLVRGVPL